MSSRLDIGVWKSNGGKGGKIAVSETLHRSLENKGGKRTYLPTIVFLSDEHSNSPAGEYAC